MASGTIKTNHVSAQEIIADGAIPASSGNFTLSKALSNYKKVVIGYRTAGTTRMPVIVADIDVIKASSNAFSINNLESSVLVTFNAAGTVATVVKAYGSATQFPNFYIAGLS